VDLNPNGLGNYEREGLGPDLKYTCTGEGVFEPQLLVFSKIRVHTVLSEGDIDAWQAALGPAYEADDTFYKQKWLKPLALHTKAGQDHIPINTLQLYLDFRKIKCNVRDSAFVQGPDDPLLAARIGRGQWSVGDEAGMAIFVDTTPSKTCTGTGKTCLGTIATVGVSIVGTDYVEIPEELCDLSTKQGAVENGMLWVEPGDYEFPMPNQDGTTSVYPTRIHCNGTMTYANDVDDHFDFEVTPAGSGEPFEYQYVNADPNYMGANGWYFRPWNSDRTEWQFYKFAQPSPVSIVEADGADGNGWSNEYVRPATGAAGRIHGLFSTNGNSDHASVPEGGHPSIAKNTQVSKEFVVPESATSCTIKWRFWKFDSWDNEYGFMHVNDEVMWTSPKGYMPNVCEDMDWVTPPESDLTKCGWGCHRNCMIDHEIVIENCASQSPLKIGFSSDINSAYNDESWGFSNFELHYDGVDSGGTQIVAHHFQTGATGVSPLGSENFVLSTSATVGDTPPSSCPEGGYASRPRTTATELTEECSLKPHNIFADPDMVMDLDPEDQPFADCIWSESNIEGHTGRSPSSGSRWRFLDDGTSHYSPHVSTHKGKTVWDLSKPNYLRIENDPFRPVESQDYTQFFWIEWRDSTSGSRSLFKHSKDYCARAMESHKLGVYSNRQTDAKAFVSPEYKVVRNSWQLVIVVGKSGVAWSGSSETSTCTTAECGQGVTEFYIGTATESPVYVGSVDRVCSYSQFDRLGTSNQGPGQLGRATVFRRAFDEKEMEIYRQNTMEYYHD
jgi:hypothetical protein